jgi:hypothetical protein
MTKRLRNVYPRRDVNHSATRLSKMMKFREVLRNFSSSNSERFVLPSGQWVRAEALANNISSEATD